MPLAFTLKAQQPRALLAFDEHADSAVRQLEQL